MRTLKIFTVSLMISACAQIPGGNLPQGSISLETLMRQVKYDVGTYLLAHQNDPNVITQADIDESEESRVAQQQAIAQGTNRLQRKGEKCTGQIDFKVEKVKLTVLTEVENKGGANASLQVPLNIATANVGASGSLSRKGSLTTSFEIAPDFDQKIEGPLVPVPQFSGLPISSTLEALRSDLIATADVEPCFNFKVQDAGANSIKWGFTVTKATGGNGKVTFVLFSLGAEASTTSAVTNTIEVTFQASGGFG